MTLHHVALETRRRDADSEIRFWGLLGFERVDPPAGLRERAAWLQAGATQVHLLFADEPVVPAQGHVAVVCADYEATQAVLHGAGFATVERTRHWGAPRCYVTSPGGHRVEVMAAPPA
jgi:catechol 2,3-dioxygenase-like lactoylglutathione lyase family enzyme